MSTAATNGFSVTNQEMGKSSIFNVFLSNVLRNTEGKFCYAEPRLLNGMGWLKQDGSEVQGWGLARLAVSEPGFYMSLRAFNQEQETPESKYSVFPIKDDNAVTQDGKQRTQYRFVKVVKVMDNERKFPNQKQAAKSLHKFAAKLAGEIKARDGRVLANKIIIETGKKEMLIDDGIVMPDIAEYPDVFTYYQRLIYMITLYRENWLGLYKADPSAATKWHLKRITAEFTSCLALAYFGIQAKADNAHISQLRNAFTVNPKKLAYAGYNCERYLQHLAS